jgi:hypothetical protein
LRFRPALLCCGERGPDRRAEIDAVTPLAPLLLAAAVIAEPALPRVVVLIDDPSPGAAMRVELEAALTRRGIEVVPAALSEPLRRGLAPADLLAGDLPTLDAKGLSGLDADAVVAGQASYGERAELEGVGSLPVRLAARVVDLATGRASGLVQTQGRGIGLTGPDLQARGAAQAVTALLEDRRFTDALAAVARTRGRVSLVVRDVPSREALGELIRGLEALHPDAGVREIYYARGLGKLSVGGAPGRSLTGPELADAIGARPELALSVDEVVGGRIVARFDRGRTVQVHALVLEPLAPRKLARRATELGRYMATRIATFRFARASYQPGRLDRRRALERARRVEAELVVESELLGSGPSRALAMRVLSTATGAVLYRSQALLGPKLDELRAADGLLEAMAVELPEQLAAGGVGVTKPPPPPERTDGDLKELEEEK